MATSVKCYKSRWIHISNVTDITVISPPCPRLYGYVITVESSRRSWPSRVTGSPVLQRNLPASVPPLASHPCAMCLETKSFALAPKLPRRQHCKNPTGLEWYPVLMPGHVASRHETCKTNFWRTETSCCFPSYSKRFLCIPFWLLHQETCRNWSWRFQAWSAQAADPSVHGSGPSRGVQRA